MVGGGAALARATAVAPPTRGEAREELLPAAIPSGIARAAAFGVCGAGASSGSRSFPGAAGGMAAAAAGPPLR